MSAWMWADAVLAGVEARRGPVLVLTTEAVQGTPAVSGVREHLTVAGAHPLIMPIADTVNVAQVRGLVAQAGAVVAVGGGSLLDRVKLAAVTTRSGSLLPVLAAPTRGGAVILPADARRGTPVVAVPTSLGTGSEASAVAVADTPGGRRLVMGTALIPDAYVHLEQATATLSDTMVREGVLEVLSRLTAPYVGDAVGEPVADAVALAAIRELVTVADAAIRDLDRTGAVPASKRLRIARIGALGHGRVLARPHDPWGVKLWALANEVSVETGWRKMPATALLWPTFWAAIARGERRWGSAQRLDQVWRTVCDAIPDLPKEPATGIAELIDRWGVSAPDALPEQSVLRCCRRIESAWGAGLPLLRGIAVGEVEQLLHDSCRTHSGTPRTVQPHPATQVTGDHRPELHRSGRVVACMERSA